MLLPLARRSAFPPVVGRLFPDHGRSNFHLEGVAELPQFLGGAGVLEQNSIDVERIELASTVAIDGKASFDEALSFEVHQELWKRGEQLLLTNQRDFENAVRRSLGIRDKRQNQLSADELAKFAAEDHDDE